MTDKECELCMHNSPATTRKIFPDGEETVLSVCYSCDCLSDEEVLKEYMK